MARRSSWVNLQDMLGLNASAGEEMGQRVTDDIAGQAQLAGRDLGRAEDDFNRQSDFGVLGGPDEDAFARAERGDTGNYHTEAEARAKSTQGYSGPKHISDVNAGLSGQVADAVARVRNAQTSTGLNQELSKSFGAQAASGTGGGALDTFLTGRSSSAALSGLSDNYGGLMDKLGLAEEAAARRVQKGEEASAASAKRWGELTPVLEKQAVDALAAQKAFDRAHEQQLWDISYQQERQHGRGNNRREAGEVHTMDEYTWLNRQGRYAEAEALRKKGEEEGWWDKAAYRGATKPDGSPWGDWDMADRGAPQPVGASRDEQYEQQRRRSATPGS